MNIILRPFQKDDIPALESIIRKTWKYDELCSPKTAALLAKVFLSSCLTNYTFSGGCFRKQTCRHPSWQL